MLMERRPYYRGLGWVERSRLIGFGYDDPGETKELKYGEKRQRGDKTSERKKRTTTSWGGRRPYQIRPRKRPPRDFTTKRGAPPLKKPPSLGGF